MIDCLTVRADAPVRPLLVTLLRCMFCMASTLDGRRWSMTSSICGSSLPLHEKPRGMMAVVGVAAEDESM